jgi:hypothetical protein
VLALPATGLAAAGLATVAAGCTTTLPTSSVAPPLDLAAARATASTERDLLARYDATIASHPALRGLLAGLRAHHAQHLAALAMLVPGVSTTDPAVTPSGTAGVRPSRGPSSGPTTPATMPATAPVDDSAAGRASALAALAKAERAAAGAHQARCQSTTTGLAPLLASLSAAESCHADLLGLAATG